MGEVVKLREKKERKLLRFSQEDALDVLDPDVKNDGLRVWLGGESGCGKSWSVALLAEQFIGMKRPIVVLDSHGEYQDLWALDPANIMRMGYGDVLTQVTDASSEWLCSLVEEGKSLLIDLSHWTDIDPGALDRFVLEFMKSLYALRRRKPQRMVVFVEEAQNYVPQMMNSGQADNIRIFLGIATGGRKYGLDLVFASQQQVLVDVRIIAACNVRMFFRTNDFNEFKKKVKPHLGTLKITFDDGKNSIKKFKSGECVLIGRWFAGRRVRLLEPEVKPRRFLDEVNEDEL